MGKLIRPLARCACLIALLLVAHLCVPDVAAQQGVVEWSDPVNLSNTPQSSMHPAIVADALGNVHVLWSEDVGGQAVNRSLGAVAGNSLLYTRWDGRNWSAPVDVLWIPGETVAEFAAVDVGPDGWLHVVWTGHSNIYYSAAPGWQAESAHAWSTPVVVSTESAQSSWESDVAIGPAGQVHVAYATRGNGAGIYYVRSGDDGASWGLPVLLSEPLGPLEVAYANVRIVADDAGRLHVVWQTAQQDGYGQAVYYARSTDAGDTWEPAVQLGYRDPGDFDTSWPYLTVVEPSELHLVYVDGAVVGARGRFHRISRDGGETWSAPQQVLTELIGINGYVVPIVDGAGQLHVIADMRTLSGQVVGIYYARWLGNKWSPVQAIDAGSEASSSAHYTAATVRQGNELHVVWTQLGTGEIWHTRGILVSVPPATPVALSGPLRVTPTAVAAPAASKPGPTRSAVTRSVEGVATEEVLSTASSAGPGRSLAFGTIMSVLLVSGMLFVVGRRRS